MLSSEDVDRIRDLVGAVAESDGEQPLNEEATLALAGSDPATSHFLQHEAGRVVGYAQSNARHATAQLLVHPERRRQGLGGQLLHDVAGVSVWAFGDLPPARATRPPSTGTPSSGTSPARTPRPAWPSRGSTPTDFWSPRTPRA